MTARNPEESPDEPKRDKVLQAIDEAPNDHAEEPAEPVRQEIPALDAPQDAVLDTKGELDRVALYLRGPTVFSA